MSTETVGQVADAILAQQTAEATASDTPIEETAQKQEGEAPPAKTEDDAPFPKKALNALSRRDKQIGRYRAELQAAQAREQALIDKYEKKAETTNPANSAPDESKFDNYGDYLKAVARFEARAELQSSKPQDKQQTPQEMFQQAKEQAWIEERTNAVEQQARDLIQKNPEYAQLLQENADVLDSFPAHVERAFLEADDPTMAFVVLAKEGKLEALANMSPARAAMEIAKAEARSATVSKPKVTNAPPPMSPNKGASQGGKSAESMSANELLKAIRKN